MKLFALITGAVLTSVGAYVVIGEHMAGVSAGAEINARLATIRAPISGSLSLRTAGIGSRVWPDQIIATIDDERVDTSRLADLRQAASSLSAENKRIETQQANLKSVKQALLSHAATYKRGRIRQLEARIGEAKAQKDAALARLREQDAALERANNLNERGVQTAANLERAKAARDVAAEELKVTDHRIAFLTIELDAARNDTFLGDSYNDAPYSVQRLRETELRLAELAAEHASLIQRAEEARNQIDEELQRLNRLRSAELTSPVEGLVWEYRSNTGEVIGRGAELVRLVDCGTVMITASVGETLYNKLKQGDAAQFRLLNNNEVFDATVTRLAGAGASSIYDNLAIAPSQDRRERYDVTLSAPGLRSHSELGCSVGRTGRVVFSGGPIEAVRQLLADLSM